MSPCHPTETLQKRQCACGLYWLACPCSSDVLCPDCRDELRATPTHGRQPPPTREQKSTQNRAYYLTHREQETAYSRAYYQAHWEQRAAYRLAHREQAAAYSRAYYQEYRAQALAYGRTYHQKQKTTHK